MSNDPVLPAQDITLYDFMFASAPIHGDQPWFMDAITGETRTPSVVKQRVDALALGLKLRLGAGLHLSPTANSTSSYLMGPVISVVSLNDIDFATAVWATHKLGCIVAPHNAGGTADELTHQLRLCGAQTIIAHPSTLDRVRTAARAAGIAEERIIVLARGKCSVPYSDDKIVHTDDQYAEEDQNRTFQTIDDLIGLGHAAILRGTVLDAPPPSEASRPRVAFLGFSSGTTGLPKAVIVPHRALIANVLQVASTHVPRMTAGPGDKVLGVIPMSHMYGLLTLVHLYPLLGITSVLFQQMPKFEKFLSIVETLPIEHLLLVPPLVNAFLKHPSTQGKRFDFFKSCLVAAAPLDIEREKDFRLLGGPNFVIGQAFGMTETAGLITGVATGVVPTPGSINRILPLTDIKIVDAQGYPVPQGQNGEMRVRGPQLCLGYLNNEAANKETFDENGYLMSGDEARMDEHGNIFVTDRLKNIIKTKGFQISPAELEGHLLKHPFVQDVGVIGKPDDRAGELPVAFVTLTPAGLRAMKDPELVKRSIKAHVKASKSEYKWLADVTILETIPKLPSGKILARELKKLLDSAPVQKSLPVVIRPLRHSSSGSASSSSEVDEAVPTTPETKYAELEKGDLEKGSGALVSTRAVPVPFITEEAKLARDKKADQAQTKFQAANEWLSYYRMFFITIFTVNIIGIGFTLAHKWDTGREWSATFALSLITAGLLARNEFFLRCLYVTLLHLFKRWPPFWFRNAITAFLLHVGGVHSGMSVSGTLWLITAMIEFFRQGPHVIHHAVLVFAVFASVVLIVVCLSASPWIRDNYHNVFENTHRLLGWFGVGVLWVLVGLADAWEPGPNGTGQFSGHRLSHKPDIYIAIFITILVFGPWTTYRKVPVKSEVLSKAVILVRFPGGHPPGLFARITRNPLRENHAFGITSTGPKAKEHYLCIVGQGDFTRGLIADPPTHLWTRSYKFTGLPIMTSFFRRGLYVVTGSAIGVALSIFMQRDPKSEWHMIWIAGNIEATYGSTVIPDLKASFAHEPEGTYERIITIWDTRVQGRPNMTNLIEDVVRKNDLEIVFVTSNPQGTADMIRGCAQRGIVCHGPVWDS